MKHLLSIFIFLSFMSVTSADESWIYQDTRIKDKCMAYPVSSRDWYESYYDHYIEEIDNHWDSISFELFVGQIGDYIGKEVPINDEFKTSWDESVSLTRNLSECIKEPTPFTANTFASKYEVVKELDKRFCKEYASNIKYECSSIVLIKHFSDTRSLIYGMTIYGLYEIDNEVLIFPLRNIQ